MSFDFAKLKSTFFDSAAVMAKTDAGTRRVLSKLGAFVRTRARSSIRKRKRASQPGQPPSAHAGQIKLIFFAWDDKTKSVVIGPIPFAGKSGTAVVPGLLERGGEISVVDKSSATGRRARSKAQAQAYKELIRAGVIVPKRLARKTVPYAARPFMGPALNQEKPRFAEQLKGLMH